MKPTFNMDGKVIMQDLPQSEVEKKPRLAKFVVGGVVAVFLLAGVIALSVFIGMKMTKDTYKDSWHTFQSQDGVRTDEKITETEDSLSIFVPNEVEVVYDYKHGLVVRRFTDSQTKERGPCYAGYMDDTFAPAKDYNYKDSTVDIKGESETVTEHWHFTTNPVPKYLQSEEVQKMCHDTSVYWMEAKGDVEKRAVCAYIVTYVEWYYATLNGACVIVRDTWKFCYDINWAYTGDWELLREWWPC